MSKHWTDVLDHPCEEGYAWAKTMPSLETAWQECQRPDWMLWYLRQTPGFGGERGSPERKRLVALARDMAREAWPYVEDGEMAMAIALCDHVVGEYLEGRADEEDCRAICTYDAYTYDAYTDAAYAAYAASASASYVSAYATREDVQRRCADHVRRYYPKGGK